MTDQTKTPDTHTYSPLQYDPEVLREHVRDMNLSTEQENALLEAVWLVIVGVIDLGLSPASQGTHSKPLVVDSSSVLALLSTSNMSNTEDAKADGSNAQRMDS
ncbi:hypothetical protein [Bradyrhizobium sp. 25ACV]